MKFTPHREFADRNREPPTLEQLADRFAAEAVQSVLTPAPDGLEVLEELAGKTIKPRG